MISLVAKLFQLQFLSRDYEYTCTWWNCQWTSFQKDNNISLGKLFKKKNYNLLLRDFSTGILWKEKIDKMAGNHNKAAN